MRVGVTVGWSQTDRRETDPMVLLQQADARLYAAKAARPLQESPAKGQAPAASGKPSAVERLDRSEMP